MYRVEKRSVHFHGKNICSLPRYTPQIRHYCAQDSPGYRLFAHPRCDWPPRPRLKTVLRGRLMIQLHTNAKALDSRNSIAE